MLHELLFRLPTGKFKTLNTKFNSFVLLFLFIILCLNKQIKKCFMIKFYITHSGNLHTFQYTKYYMKSILIENNKTCKKVLRLNMVSTTKVKVEKFSFIVEKSYLFQFR